VSRSEGALSRPTAPFADALLRFSRGARLKPAHFGHGVHVLTDGDRHALDDLAAQLARWDHPARPATAPPKWRSALRRLFTRRPTRVPVTNSR
jgi:hypothetical protein